MTGPNPTITGGTILWDWMDDSSITYMALIRPISSTVTYTGIWDASGYIFRCYTF